MLLLCIATVMPLLLSGCGGGALSSASGSGLSSPSSASISSFGGSLASGTSNLTVPANAVSSLTTFSIGPTTTYPSDSRLLAGSAYIVGTGGAYLLQPLTLTIQYSTLPTGAVTSSLTMYSVVNNTWKAVSSSTLNTSASTVSATIQSAGTYAIFITQTTSVVSSGTILFNRGATTAANALSAMNTTGSSYVALLSSTANAYTSSAHFSPTGTTIAYSHTDGVHGFSIYSMNSDGTNVTTLTGGQTKPDSTYANSYYPAFSTDGTTIVFVSDRTGVPQVYTMTSAGASVTEITSIQDTAISNVFFTHAGLIAFNATVNGVSAWYQVSTAGTGLASVNSTPANISLVSPWTAYSPSGTTIASGYQVGTGYDLYVFNTTGSAKTRLTTLGASAIIAPRFTSDGTKIVFQATVGGAGSIFVVNIDGTGLTNLTATNGPDSLFDLY